MERYHNYQSKQKKKAKKAAPDPELLEKINEHIREIGLKNISAYRKWCKRHGFRPVIEKCERDLWAEKRVYRSQLSNRSLRKKRKIKNLPKLIQQIRDGELTVCQQDKAVLVCLAEHINPEKAANDEQKLEFLLYIAENTRLLLDVDYIDAVAKLVKYKKGWLRGYTEWKPQSRNIEKQFISLLHHLFAHYPVPNFISRQIISNHTTAKKALKLFIHLGQGKSVRRFEGFKLVLTKKVAHYFLQAPGDSTIKEALRWAQTMSLGGSKQLANVVRNGLGRFSFQHDKFWLTVVRFFIAHPVLKPGDFGPVVDFIYAMKYETHRVVMPGGHIGQVGPEKPGFSMKGRTPKSLMRQVEKWHRQTQKSSRFQHLKWGSAGFTAMRIEEGKKQATNYKVWQFVELLSGRELLVEGRKQNHCVATYTQACANGRASIWSLYCNEERTVTIEVIPATKRIVQIRGKSNRLAKPRERKIITQWAARNGLIVSTYA